MVKFLRGGATPPTLIFDSGEITEAVDIVKITIDKKYNKFKCLATVQNKDSGTSDGKIVVWPYFSDESIPPVLNKILTGANAFYANATTIVGVILELENINGRYVYQNSTMINNNAFYGEAGNNNIMNGITGKYEGDVYITALEFRGGTFGIGSRIVIFGYE